MAAPAAVPAVIPISAVAAPAMVAAIAVVPVVIPVSPVAAPAAVAAPAVVPVVIVDFGDVRSGCGFDAGLGGSPGRSGLGALGRADKQGKGKHQAASNAERGRKRWVSHINTLFAGNSSAMFAIYYICEGLSWFGGK